MGRQQGAGPGAEVLGGEIIRGDLAEVLVDVARVDRLGLPGLVDELKQVLARQIPTAFHQAGDPPVGEGDLVILAALAAEAEANLRAIDPDVAILQGGQAK